jgi:hypothetical protein
MGSELIVEFAKESRPRRNYEDRGGGYVKNSWPPTHRYNFKSIENMDNDTARRVASVVAVAAAVGDEDRRHQASALL